MLDRANRAILPFAAAFAVLAGCGQTSEAIPEIPVGIDEGMRPPPLAGTLADGAAFELTRTDPSPAVLVFYRSAGCGLCRVQLQQIQRNLAAYRAEGAAVLGITLDPPEASRALIGEIGLEIPLVSVDSATFERWGVIDPEHRVSLPATYILDDEGVIRFRHVGRNASDRTTDAGVLTVLHRVATQ